MLQLTCGNCGASIAIPAEQAFVDCRYCRCSLEVQQAGGAAFAKSCTNQLIDSINLVNDWGRHSNNCRPISI